MAQKPVLRGEVEARAALGQEAEEVFEVALPQRVRRLGPQLGRLVGAAPEASGVRLAGLGAVLQGGNVVVGVVSAAAWGLGPIAAWFDQVSVE